jgi:hypothetical protein
MPWTNKHNIPSTLALAIKRSNSKYKHNDDPNYFSATELLQPVRITVLKRRYRGKITRDIGDAIYMADGNSLHEMLDEVPMELPVLLKESRQSIKLDGYTVSGQIDLYQEGGIVSDWKRTSVHAALREDKPEWAGQLNIYGMLLRNIGLPVNELHIYAILRDWMKGKLEREKNYPPIAFIDRQFPVWQDDDVRQYCLSRIAAVKAVENFKVDELPLCTPDERWTRDENWGAIKRGNKIATKKFYVEGEAEGWASYQKAEYDIEHRPGVPIRCRDWCDVCEFCDYWHDNVKEKDAKS